MTEVERVEKRLQETWKDTENTTDPVLKRLQGGILYCGISEVSGYLQACEDFGHITPFEAMTLRQKFHVNLDKILNARAEKRIAAGEATRDPIFVLIRYWWHCCPECRYAGEEINGEIVDPCELPCDCRSEHCPIGTALDRKKTKDVVSVFLTREEAEAYGKSQEHNLGKQGDGWIVWCCPCDGELAALLRAVG